MGAAVLCALGAAACIALAAALQHHAATGEAGYRTGAHLVARLARNPWWTLGFCISAVGLALHGLALHFGALAVVQPLLITSLVFALPMRALLDRDVPSLAELAAAAVVVVGLAGFLLAAHPTIGTAAADGHASAWILASGLIVVPGCSATASRTSRNRLAGFALGVGTGVAYGLVGGSLKATVHVAAGGLGGLLTSWPLWALIVTGAWGLVINQRAYTHAPLRVSLPAMTVADPIVAVIFGAYAFGEMPSDTPLSVVMQLICLTVLAAGVTALAAHQSFTASLREVS